MAVLRRHLFAATWLILSLHALGAALGAAQVCREQAHTHGGVAAPDCPMHHQETEAPAPAEHHAHHGGAPTSAPANSSGARMTCQCAGDVAPLLLGQSAVLPASPAYSPLVSTVTLDVLNDPMAVDLWSAPPAPPPR